MKMAKAAKVKQEPTEMEEDNTSEVVNANEEATVKKENGLQTTDEDKKRKITDDDESGQPKRKKFQRKKKVRTSQPKNALMQLNELKPGLRYIVESQEGPPHNPTFVVYVEVSGEKFVGKGASKQLAKHAAAQLALASFVQFQNTPEALKTFDKRISSLDFTTDNVENESAIFNRFEANRQNGKGPVAQPSKDAPDDQGPEDKQKRLDKVTNDADKKNPVMLLNEIHPGVEFTLVRENMSLPSQRFTMSVVINGTTFEGSGPNKKLAKGASAKVALSALYNINYSIHPTISDSIQGTIPEIFIFPQVVADKISSIIQETFQEVMVGNTEYAKWKVLAGIVMSTDNDMTNLKVIALSTGTKCINGEHISMNGASLNDCHAEILSRRCLKDYLYTNLEMHAAGQADDSILVARKGGGFTLKPEIKFHLYISTSPCGDARIFSPHEETISKEPIDRHPNRKARGLLRTKIESGEGTIPVKPGDAIQTWDGIIQGQQRLLTMSCSDKIAAWNVLGMQGALLGHFIEPIYLESIVLGSLFHPGHMFRAMWGRFENKLGSLIEPYRLTKPRMCCITNPETRQLSKSPNFSVNWTSGLGRPEVINATTGKLENGQVSRVSKRSLFDRFSKLLGKISRVTDGNSTTPKMYAEAKNDLKSYQLAKQELRKAFKESSLGTWVQKPVEQDEFELTF